MLFHDTISMLLEAGSLAPSGGNIQPWRVIVRADTMEIWLDSERSTSFLDIGRYASVMAIGSFVENVLIKSHGLGLRASLAIHDAISLEQPVVVITFAHASSPEVHPLEQQLERRATNRKPHRGPPIDERRISDMSAVLSEATRLHTVSSDDDKRAVAEIVGKSDIIRMRHPVLHAQTWSEVRWTREEVEATRDGIDIATMEFPEHALPQVRTMLDHGFVMQHVPDEVLVGMTMAGLMDSSHLGCLSVVEELSVISLITAGRDLQRMWLRASELGVALQPWTVVTFLLLREELHQGAGFSPEERAVLADLGRELRALFGIEGGRRPIFCFRLSRADEPSTRALRRPPSDFSVSA